MSTLFLLLLQLVCQVNCQDPPISGLFFSLNDIIYLNGNSVNIEDIGADVYNRALPGDALVCNTSNINTNCCRNIDNNNDGAIGDWFYPNNSQVLRNRLDQTTNNIFVRIGYTRQVRLVRRGNLTGPLGLYRCEVPSANGELESASIYITSGSGISLLTTHEIIEPNTSHMTATQEPNTSHNMTSGYNFKNDKSIPITDGTMSNSIQLNISIATQNIASTTDKNSAFKSIQIIISTVVAVTVSAIILTSTLVIFIHKFMLHKNKSIKRRSREDDDETHMKKNNHEEVVLTNKTNPCIVNMTRCVAYEDVSGH